MNWLCAFSQCRWIWHFNADDAQEHNCVGIYQCLRCKSISVGAPRSLPQWAEPAREASSSDGFSRTSQLSPHERQEG